MSWTLHFLDANLLMSKFKKFLSSSLKAVHLNSVVLLQQQLEHLLNQSQMVINEDNMSTWIYLRLTDQTVTSQPHKLPIAGLFTPPPSPHRCPAPLCCHINRRRVFPEPFRSHRCSCPWRPQCNAAGRPAAVVENSGRDGWCIYPHPPAGAGGRARRTVRRGVSRCQQIHWGGWNKSLTWWLTDLSSVHLGFNNQSMC